MLKAGGITMPASIFVPVLVNVAAFALLCAYFVVKRVRLLEAEREALA
jgi:hypothetical protein